MITGITHSATYQEYLTAAELRVGVGYPQSLVSRGYSVTLALIYAGGAPNNALCASVGGGRSRRAIDTGTCTAQSASQPVIQSTIQSAIYAINQSVTKPLSSSSSVIHPSTHPARLPFSGQCNPPITKLVSHSVSHPGN